MVRNFLITSLFVLTCMTSLLPAQNSWPQWRGPDRTDLSKERGLLQQWPADGPEKRWVVDSVGKGYAGPAVVGDRIFILGAHGNSEYLMALNVDDGKEIWKTEIGELLTNGWGDGPRATPTLDGRMIYALGGKGNLVCVDADSGEVKWSLSMQSLGGSVPTWGYTESVLVTDKHVICTPGGERGAIAAIDKSSGKLAWQAKDVTDGAQYSSPIMPTVHGKPQIVQLFMHSLVGVDPANGGLLWKSDWPGRTAVIPTPIADDNKIFIASGYGVGCKLVEINRDQSIRDVWMNTNMKNHHGGVILLDGHLYGFSDGFGWVCMRLDNGELVWREKDKLGKGAISYADGKFYLLEEGSGEVVLIDATTKGWSEKGRFKLDPQTENRSPKGKIWVHPVIVNGRMYLRDQELFFSYDVSHRR